MTKAVKSQWDFGELFPTPPSRRVLSVSELTGQIRRLLETQVGQIWISGEITNLRAQGSGHVYFSLKDATAQLNCVLFRGEPVSHREALQDGQKVTLQGELTVYEPRGQYQLRVTAIELQGIGALQQAFEKLKKRLQAEGLFAPGRKRPLPRYPQRLGIVTSHTAAALRDVIHVVERRHPRLELVLATCRVQGQGAAEEIACAIRLLNEWNAKRASLPTTDPPDANLKVDLILVTRGGGSLEDLWAFNEEVVARAVFESVTPVVSAVGHEIDFTICDFVADLRAATPSAAAEIITDGAYTSRRFVSEAPDRLRLLANRRLVQAKDGLRACEQRLSRLHPRRQLNERLQRLDDLQIGLAREVQQRLRAFSSLWRVLTDRLLRVRPSEMLRRQSEMLCRCQEQLRTRARLRLDALSSRVTHAETRLRLLSPTNVLDRGYSITLDAATGRVIRGAEEVRPGQRLLTRVKAGQIQSKVEDKEGA